MSPRLDHTLAIAALTQSLMRMLYTLRRENKRWRQYDRFLIEENRWRAQRYGVTEGLIDFGIGEVVPFAEMLEELIELVTPHAAALGCLQEGAERARDIARGVQFGPAGCGLSRGDQGGRRHTRGPARGRAVAGCGFQPRGCEGGVLPGACNWRRIGLEPWSRGT